jgi:MFS family permease
VIRLPPAALRHRQFTLIWVGLIISMVGSQMQQWALFWHISRLSSAPIAVSIVGAVRFAAVLSFSMIGGLVADRYNRKAILFITQSTMLLVALVLGVLTLTGVIQLCILTRGSVTARRSITTVSLVPNRVPEICPMGLPPSITFNTGAIARWRKRSVICLGRICLPIQLVFFSGDRCWPCWGRCNSSNDR